MLPPEPAEKMGEAVSPGLSWTGKSQFMQGVLHDAALFKIAMRTSMDVCFAAISERKSQSCLLAMLGKISW